VSDISHHDIADEAFHEIQLSGKQLVFLFMATTIVAVVIFLCGVQVGRGVRIERTADATDTVAAATPAPAPAAAVASTATAGPPPPIDAPAPPTEEPLSYAKQLQSDSTAQEKLKPRTDPPPVAKSPEPAVEPPSKEKPAAAAASRTPAATSGGAPRAGVWVVQVQALKGQGAANAVAQRLSGKGYPAFVLSPAPGAPSIYRVQVGRFNDRREAEQVARRLEKEEQFKPWISH
jgi:cell division septation protein DedD